MYWSKSLWSLNAAQGEKLREAAQSHRVLLVEALWTAFLPKFDVLRQVLAEGILGKIHTVVANHGEHFEPDHRIMRADLAGGPMLDLGTYPIAFSNMVLGEPKSVQAYGEPAPSGVNGQAAILFKHEGAAISLLHCTLFGHSPCDAFVTGENGMLTIPGKFYTPGPLTISVNDLTTKLVYEEEQAGYKGFCHQINHFAFCVENGVLQSPIHPLSDSIATLRSMDSVRDQLGIIFDEEHAERRSTTP